VLNALDRWVSKALGAEFNEHPQFGLGGTNIKTVWAKLRQRLQEVGYEVLLPSARDILFEIADVVMGVLLVVDAMNDTNPVAVELCSRYLNEHGLVDGRIMVNERRLGCSLELNQKIVYGDDKGNTFTSQSKL